MRLVVAVVALTALVSGSPNPGFISPLVGYHEAVGIPEAARIRAEEEEMKLRPVQAGSLVEDERIVGGAIAPTNSHPYLGGLVINFVNIAGQSVCGSTLVTTSRLVTAAHCWFDGVNQASMFTVVLGSQYLFTGGTRIATSSVAVHPQWTPSTLANDVAVIYLPTSVFPTQAIQPVALPTGTQLTQDFVGMWGTAAGYGKTSDAGSVTTATQVSQVNIQVISVVQCQAIFGTWALASNICTSGAGGVGICGGDSGGPLVVNYNGQTILVGISSFVAANGCQLGFPSAFARVTSFYSFIIQNL